MNPKNVVRKVLPKKGVRLAEESYRRGRVAAVQAAYRFPAKNMRVIAVTGTNGKTTTSCFINEIVKAAGHKTALYTTALVELGGEQEVNKTHRTVPLTTQLVAFLKRAQKANVDFLILETTSQALDQHKLLGIPVEVAVLTNISRDHLDYHGTMQNYAAAKAKLFNSYRNPEFCVLNADDEYYDYFLGQSAGSAVGYGEGSDSAERITNIKSTKDGMAWTLNNGKKAFDLSIPLPGKFNVLNATAAATAALLVGVKPKHIAKGLANVKTIPGRMESVEAGQSYKIWIDYAITPDAMEKVLQAGHDAVKGKVHIVFGATGNRDRGKRPLMGEVAAKHADFIYLTDDETYDEDGDNIRRSVMQGIVAAKGKSKTKEIADRKQAIAAALKAAKKDDVVIVTGIGHQHTRTMGKKQIPWSEREVINSLLKSKL